MVPGIGMYRQDQRDNSIADPNEYNHETQSADEWWNDNMSRITLPQKESKIPKLTGTTMVEIVWYICRLIGLLANISYNNVWEKILGGIEMTASLLLPKSSKHKYDQILQQEHLHRIKERWKSLDPLPTFGAQAETINMLQAICHDSSLEEDHFLSPEDTSTKTVVKLLMDKRNRPHVQCTIEESVPALFLVDSGAALSILSYDTYCKIPHRDSLPRTYDVPTIFDHQHNKIPVKFCVTVRVLFGDKTLLLPLLVSPASKSNVIGMDSLVGRSIVFSVRGAEAVIIIGESLTEKKTIVMQIPDNSPLYVLEDTIVPAESIRTVHVSPCIFPMQVDIPDTFMRLTYMSPMEGFEGRTTHIQLDDEGKAKIRICNRSLVDMFLTANQVIATGKYDEDYIPLPRTKKLKRTKLTSDQKPELIQPSPEIEGIAEVAGIDQGEAKSKVEEEDCFCKIPEDTLIIRCNRFGDCNIPYFNVGGYDRSPLTSGKLEKIKRGKKEVILVYATTQKDYNTALDQCSEGAGVAYISNKDETKIDKNFRFIKIIGKCDLHPFPYDHRPKFISFCRTLGDNHLNMVHDLSTVTTFEVLNIKVEMYTDKMVPDQVHYILHVPDILVLRQPWIHTLVGSLVKPFTDTVRILEPYLVGEDKNLRNMMFYSILDKVAKLHHIIIQGRDPKMETTFRVKNMEVKGCTCDACVKHRENRTYTNLAGGVNQDGNSHLG